MSERSRKRERQAKRAQARAPQSRTITTPAKPAPPSSMRSTFKVAAANRQIADTLPDVIYQKSAEKRSRSISLDRSPVQAVTINAPTSAKKVIADQRVREQLTLDRQAPDEVGKCRPKDNTPKGAAGSGKAFVPWKKNC